MNPEPSTKDNSMPMTVHPKQFARKQWARRVGMAVALTMMAVPLLAQAQRKSPLADAPAIRKRYELRKLRFELGAGMGSTLDQDFYHTLLVDVRLGFHFTDWLSLAAVGGFAASNIATGFENNVVGSLFPDQQTLNREPTKSAATASMEKINNLLGLQLEFTPFTGKYSLFGKLFAAYDFYAFVGGGILSVSAVDASGLTACADHNTKTGTPSDFSCDPSGTKPGFNLGLGLHTYFNQWFGLNVELRDFLAKLNPAGRDVNGDQIANSDDDSWINTFMVSLNLVFYLPTTAGISQ